MAGTADATAVEIEAQSFDGLEELADEVLICEEPGCGEEIRAHGKMPARTYMGLHLKRVHGIAGSTPPSRRGRSSGPKKVAGPPTPLGVVRAAVDDEVGRGKRPPTADQLGRTLGRIYGYATSAVWAITVEGDERLTDEERGELVEHLAPTPTEAQATMAPFGRMLSASSLNKKYGRALVDNSDVLDAMVAIFEQYRRATAYLRERRTGMQPSALGAVDAASAPTSAAPPRSSADFARGTGVVVTPSMIGRTDLEPPSHDAPVIDG